MRSIRRILKWYLHLQYLQSLRIRIDSPFLPQNGITTTETSNTISFNPLSPEILHILLSLTSLITTLCGGNLIFSVETQT